MQCDRAQEFLSDYLERTLDRPMTVALEAHLASCAGCREDVEALQATFSALEVVPEVEPPRDGAWQVMMKLREARAVQSEAERRRVPTFMDWLRTLNPMSAAMGASLATLIIGGGLMVVPGLERLLIVGPGPVLPPAAAPRPDAAPALTVSYGAVKPDGREIDLQLLPSSDIPDAEVRVTAGTVDFAQPVSLRSGTLQEVLVPVAALVKPELTTDWPLFRLTVLMSSVEPPVILD